MKRFCFALDLRDDESAIAQYIALHRPGPPAIHKSIRDAGVLDMQIFRIGRRLFMIMDTTDDFTAQHKAELDAANLEVQAWERLVSRFQDAEEGSEFAARWKPMEKIFQLDRDPLDA